MNNPKPRHDLSVCRCHPRCLGHFYHGETLICLNKGCERSWFQEKYDPTPCQGKGHSPNDQTREGRGDKEYD